MTANLRAGVLLLAIPIVAIGLMIDDFQAGAYELGREGTNPPYTVSDTQYDAGGEHIIGGQRDVTFYKISGDGTQPNCNCIPDVEYAGDLGFSTYNSAFGCNAVWTTTYGLGSDLNTNMTGGDALEVSLISGDMDNSDPQRPVALTLRVFSSAGDGSSTRDLIAEGLYSFPFADFPSVDFADVDRIEFEIVQDSDINDAIDFALGFFQTNGAVATHDVDWTGLKKSY
ncbi:hypothetical protein H8E52_12630 [bacterium]|nr:hypothetical protein [bacterium]